MAVLTGDETAFCAGADLKDLPRCAPAGRSGRPGSSSCKPVIAAVEGWCVAGGLELAAWCDLRVAGDGARFGCLERRWGVPLIDGGTYRLPRIVGLGRALDLILTGREIDADEAHSIGLVDRVVPDGTALDAAVELAEPIAAFPWRCVVHDRRSVYEGLGLGLEEALANEDRHGREVIFAEGFADGVARFERRAAMTPHRPDRSSTASTAAGAPTCSYPPEDGLGAGRRRALPVRRLPRPLGPRVGARRRRRIAPDIRRPETGDPARVTSAPGSLSSSVA